MKGRSMRRPRLFFYGDRRKKSYAKTAQKEEPVCLIGRMIRYANKSFVSVSEHMGGGPYMLQPHELLQYDWKLLNISRRNDEAGLEEEEVDF